MSGPVAERLLSGALAIGMSKQEVRLCLGAPDRRDKGSGTGEPREVWEYSEPAFKKGELQSSKMWATAVPTVRVRFGADGKVASYRYFGARPAAVSSVKPVPEVVSPSRSAPASPVPERRMGVDPSRGVGSAHQIQEPQVNTLPAAWPVLTLNGVSVVEGVPYAMLNRQVVSPGGHIEGVTLLYVRGDGVYLQLNASVCFLAIGRTVGK